MTLLDTLIEMHCMQEYAATIKSLSRPCIRINAVRTPQEKFGPLDSRLGGIPCVRKGTPWPVWGKKNLSHLATINCAAAAACDVEGLLPREGLLQFWYVEDQSVWGFDPKDRGAFRVDYIAPGTELELARPPKKLEVFESCRVEFSKGVSLPNWEWIREFSPQHHELPELEGYQAVEMGIRVGGSHQMLGYASLVQGPMELECQLVSNGIYCGDASGYEDPRRKVLEPGALDWRVLLELDTDDDGPGWMWGDVGTMYYWITRDSLAARRFETCWTILQCC